MTSVQNEQPTSNETSEAFEDRLKGVSRGLVDSGLSGQLTGVLKGREADLTQIDSAKLHELIKALSALEGEVDSAHEEGKKAAEDLRNKVVGVLETEEGARIEKARKAFRDLKDTVEESGIIQYIDHFVPEYNYTDHFAEYQVFDKSFDAQEMDGEGYEADKVYELNIGHLATYDANNFDHNGGHTMLTIRMSPEGKVVYEFEGDELDEEFQAGLVALVEKITSHL